MEALALAWNDESVTAAPAARDTGFLVFDIPLPLPPGAPVGTVLLAAAGLPGTPHPDDEPRIAAALAAAGRTDAWTEVEHRIRHETEERWLLTRLSLHRDDTGLPVSVSGLHLDITARRIEALMAEMVTRELAHRMKNVFAVVASMLNLSLRGTPESELQAEELGERLGALAIAYRLLEPHEGKARGVGLGTLLDAVLAPFEGGAALHLDDRLDDLPVSERAATALALILHELATNAAKHGALAQAAGSVRVDVLARPGAALLRWTESLAGRALRAPAEAGFGSQLFDRLSAELFGAPMLRAWRPEGLLVELTLPLDRLAPG